jgi:hypothetical protein
MSYATVAQLRTYLSQVGDGTAETTLLQAILDRATGIIDTALGFTLAAYPGSATALVVLHGGGPYLKLPPHLAGSITIVVDPSGSTVPTINYVEDTDGDLYRAPTGYWSLSGESPYSQYPDPNWPIGRYTITAKWGAGPASAAVEQVCLELAVNIWRGKDRGMFTETVGVDGAGGLIFTGGLTNQQAAILRQVRAQYIGPVSIL